MAGARRRVPPRPAKPGPATRGSPGRVDGVAPPEAAQEGAQGGWRLDRAAQGAGRPPGAQHIGVVNAVAPSQRGSDQRQHLVPSVRPSRRSAEVKVIDRCRAYLPTKFGQGGMYIRGAMKIGLVPPVKPSHPYLGDDPAPLLDLHYLRISPWLWFSNQSLCGHSCLGRLPNWGLHRCRCTTESGLGSARNGIGTRQVV